MNAKKESPLKVVGAGLAVVVGAVWFFEKSGPTGMREIEQQVAADAVAQYEIAKRGGDTMQTCAQAGLVTAAFIQAKDEENYTKWKAIEKSDCARAGMPTP